MGLLSRKPILKWALYPENLFSNGPSIQKYYPHTGIRAYYDIQKEPKSGFRNSKIPKMGLMIQESSQSLHRLLVE